jgi:phosphoribosylglycinamide formyltransferase-1
MTRLSSVSRRYAHLVQPRIVVLASGSGTLLQALIDAGIAVLAVGSDRADAVALTRVTETFVCDPRDYADREAWNSALLDILRSFQPDLIVSAGFMRILGPTIVQAFPHRIINTHPALLPAFPGAHAVRDALAAGVSVTGCTVHYVDEGVDTGEIIEQRTVAVQPDDDVERLHERIKVAERSLLIDTVRRLSDAIRKDASCAQGNQSGPDFSLG